MPGEVSGQDPSQVYLPASQQPMMDEEAEQSVAQNLAAEGEIEEGVTGKKRKGEDPSVSGAKRGRSDASQATAKRETDDTFVDGAAKAQKADASRYQAGGITTDLENPTLPRQIGGQMKGGNAFLQLGGAIAAKLGGLHAARMQMEIRFLDQQTKTEIAQMIYQLEKMAAEFKMEADIKRAEAQFTQGLASAIGGGIQAGTAGVSIGMQMKSMRAQSNASKKYNQEMGAAGLTKTKPNAKNHHKPTSEKGVRSEFEGQKGVGPTDKQIKQMQKDNATHNSKMDQAQAKSEAHQQAEYDTFKANKKTELEAEYRADAKNKLEDDRSIPAKAQEDIDIKAGNYAEANASYLKLDGSSPSGLSNTSDLKPPPATIGDVRNAYQAEEPKPTNFKGGAESAEYKKAHADWKTKMDGIDNGSPAEQRKILRQEQKMYGVTQRTAQSKYDMSMRKTDIQTGMARSLTEMGHGVSMIITGSGQMIGANQQIAAAELEYIAEDTKAYARLLDNLVKMIDTNIQDLQQSIMRALDIAKGVSEIPLNTRLF